jgi:hypothetical protein
MDCGSPVGGGDDHFRLHPALKGATRTFFREPEADRNAFQGSAGFIRELHCNRPLAAGASAVNNAFTF